MNDMRAHSPSEQIASLRQLFRMKRRSGPDRNGDARPRRPGQPVAEGDTRWLETSWGDTRQQGDGD
jgi:hypothetical protein